MKIYEWSELKSDEESSDKNTVTITKDELAKLSRAASLNMADASELLKLKVENERLRIALMELERLAKEALGG